MRRTVVAADTALSPRQHSEVAAAREELAVAKAAYQDAVKAKGDAMFDSRGLPAFGASKELLALHKAEVGLARVQLGHAVDDHGAMSPQAFNAAAEVFKAESALGGAFENGIQNVYNALLPGISVSGIVAERMPVVEADLTPAQGAALTDAMVKVNGAARAYETARAEKGDAVFALDGRPAFGASHELLALRTAEFELAGLELSQAVDNYGAMSPVAMSAAAKAVEARDLLVQLLGRGSEVVMPSIGASVISPASLVSETALTAGQRTELARAETRRDNAHRAYETARQNIGDAVFTAAGRPAFGAAHELIALRSAELQLARTGARHAVHNHGAASSQALMAAAEVITRETALAEVTGRGVLDVSQKARLTAMDNISRTLISPLITAVIDHLGARGARNLASAAGTAQGMGMARTIVAASTAVSAAHGVLTERFHNAVVAGRGNTIRISSSEFRKALGDKQIGVVNQLREVGMDVPVTGAHIDDMVAAFRSMAQGRELNTDYGIDAPMFSVENASISVDAEGTVEIGFRDADAKRDFEKGTLVLSREIDAELKNAVAKAQETGSEEDIDTVKSLLVRILVETARYRMAGFGFDESTDSLDSRQLIDIAIKQVVSGTERHRTESIENLIAAVASGIREDPGAIHVVNREITGAVAAEDTTRPDDLRSREAAMRRQTAVLVDMAKDALDVERAFMAEPIAIPAAMIAPAVGREGLTTPAAVDERARSIPRVERDMPVSSEQVITGLQKAGFYPVEVQMTDRLETARTIGDVITMLRQGMELSNDKEILMLNAEDFDKADTSDLNDLVNTFDVLNASNARHGRHAQFHILVVGDDREGNARMDRIISEGRLQEGTLAYRHVDEVDFVRSEFKPAVEGAKVNMTTIAIDLGSAITRIMAAVSDNVVLARNFKDAVMGVFLSVNIEDEFAKGAVAELRKLQEDLKRDAKGARTILKLESAADAETEETIDNYLFGDLKAATAF